MSNIFIIETISQSLWFSIMNGNTITNTYGATVVDEVVGSTTYPFINIGDDTITDYSTKDLDGGEITMTLHIWSQYKGAKETKQIMDRLHEILHDSSLSVSGFNLINSRFEFSDILRDPDGVTRHGVMRFRVITLGTN